jgi:hypothetical protein
MPCSLESTPLPWDSKTGDKAGMAVCVPRKTPATARPARLRKQDPICG